MSAKIINGKKISNKILLDIKKSITKLKKQPGLAAILVGDNQESKLYLNLKQKACHKVGIDFHSYFLDDDCAENKIISVIKFLNTDPQIDGIIVQLPLPKNYDTKKIINSIDPKKDIDGFHPKSKFTSPNALGIIELIKSTKVTLNNKKITILSNSELFAKPFKKLLANNYIKYINPKNLNLKYLKLTDFLIVAIGKPKFIKPDMIKKDAILIDVGINKQKSKVIGDISPTCDKVAAFRSPVPGGVGPMTVAMLLKNLVKK